MAERYPLRLRGEEIGALTVERRGLVTEFTARCPDPGRLVRLSVYGGGAEGYLGVMEPTGGMLSLCRKLTREAMRSFPDQIEYAAEAGGAPAPPGPGERVTASGRGTRQNPRQNSQSSDVLWRRVGDGSLYALWRGKAYRAIPMAAWGLPLERAVDRRVIDGVEYAIFSLENGE